MDPAVRVAAIAERRRGMITRTFRHGGELVEISARREGDQMRLTTAAGERTFLWEELGPGEYLLRDGARLRRCVVARAGDDRWIWIDGHVHHLKLESPNRRRAATPEGELTAPMPGQVLKVLVAAGEAVAKNQTLVVLEAMKMQYEITAPRDGIVQRVHAAAGTQVSGGVVLVSLADAAS